MSVDVKPLSKLLNKFFKSRPGELGGQLIYLVDMIGSNYQDKWMAAIENDDQLWDAIRHRYLERGADINVRGSLGKTALQGLCEKDFPGTVAKMIAAGADPNLADTHLGFTPLMQAAIECRHGVMKALVEGGANVSATTTDKGNSVMWFLINNVEYKCRDNPQAGRDCLQLLLDNGATLSDADKRMIFKSAPSLASLAPGVPEALEVATAAADPSPAGLKGLLEKGANPDAAAAFGAETVLQCTIRTKGSAAHIDVLLENGASIKLPSPVSGYTPLQEAVHAGNRRLFQKLLGMGADPEAPMANGRPADLLGLARASDGEGMEEFVRQTLETYKDVQYAVGTDRNIAVGKPLHLKLKTGAATPSCP